MHIGGKLSAVLVLLLAGCGGNDGKLTVRAIPAPLSRTTSGTAALLAEGNGQLRLGNVGLALEAFRKAQREAPQSTDALAGIATCYGQMARYDLARRYYEEALAISPNDVSLLSALAALFDRQGHRADALAVRNEIARLQVAAITRLEPRVAAVVASIVAPKTELTALDETAVVSVSKPAKAQPVAPALAPAAKTNSAPVAKSASKAVAQSVTVKLPSAFPDPLAPAPAKPIVIVHPATHASLPNGRGPRLERISLAEVALVSSGPARWRGEVVRKTATASTIRFVPLAQVRQASVRLLNAARWQGLAARTRVALTGKGWSRVSIGDADRVRHRSLVLFSPGSEQAARRLATEFGFAVAKASRPGPLTVLLGRDAIAKKPA